MKSLLGTSVQALLDENYKSINAGKMKTEALERQDSAVLLLVSGNWEEGRSIIQAADTSFKESFDAAKRNVTIPGEQAYVDEIESKYAAYKNLWMKPMTN